MVSHSSDTVKITTEVLLTGSSDSGFGAYVGIVVVHISVIVAAIGAKKFLGKKKITDFLIFSIQGNLNVGNNKETLFSTVTQLLPYIGYPRISNTIACLYEIIPE